MKELKEKLDAIDNVKAGKPIDDVAKKFGIRQVYKLYKTKGSFYIKSTHIYLIFGNNFVHEFRLLPSIFMYYINF